MATSFLLCILAAGDTFAMQPDYNDIFFEHPSGEFKDSKTATIAAVSRLYKYEQVDRWLTLYAQGTGYQDYPVRIKKPFIAVTDGLNITEVLVNSGIELNSRKAVEAQESVYDLSQFSAEEVGAIVYSIYINHYKVEPFQGDDFFAVAGEWL